MPKTKQKVTLSENLQLGVAGPTAQSALFKVFGVFFLLLALMLAKNIYSNLHQMSGGSATLASQPVQQQVLGASDNASLQFSNYTVQHGDTLFNISQDKGINWQVIATLNNLTPPYALHAGMTLKLPVSK